LQEGHLYYTLHGHHSASTAGAFSPDDYGGKYFATAGADAQVMIWKAGFNWPDDEDVGPALSGGKTKRREAANAELDIGNQNVEIGETFSLERPAAHDEPRQPATGPKMKSVPTAPVDSTIPGMASALTQLVHQLDLLTQTMSIIEDRLSKVETRVSSLQTSADHQ
jgi:centriolar protein POC1